MLPQYTAAHKHGQGRDLKRGLPDLPCCLSSGFGMHGVGVDGRGFVFGSYLWRTTEVVQT